jgi:phytoene dehydrogenase-like protein
MDQNRRGAAYHEAGHGVVAIMLGCQVKRIDVSQGYGAGSADIVHQCDMSFRDRIAICVAGDEAQKLFDAPTHRGSAQADFGGMASLLDGFDDATSLAIRCAGRRRAREILEEQRPSAPSRWHYRRNGRHSRAPPYDRSSAGGTRRRASSYPRPECACGYQVK